MTRSKPSLRDTKTNAFPKSNPFPETLLALQKPLPTKTIRVSLSKKELAKFSVMNFLKARKANKRFPFDSKHDLNVGKWSLPYTFEKLKQFAGYKNRKSTMELYSENGLKQVTRQRWICRVDLLPLYIRPLIKTADAPNNAAQ